MKDQLPIGHKVRILQHQHTGYTAKVAGFDQVTGFYTVRLLLDPEGNELLNIQISGPYARSELEPITHHPARGSSAMEAKDGAFLGDAA